MPATVRDLAPFITVTTSAAAVTSAVGKLDDASSITIFMASSAGMLSSAGISLQISQFDPFDPVLPSGVTESTAFYTVSTSSLTTSGTTVVLTNISFRGLRLVPGVTSGNTLNEVVARASKQISV